MRGIAAMMVFFIHSIAMPESIGVDWAVPFVSKYGPAGVDIFFVISGFVIAMVANANGQNSQDRAVAVREFTTKRLIRIYPIYWLVLILATAASGYIFLAPASVPNNNFWALFFLVEPSNNKIMAAWTLAYEMYFYLVVALILFIIPKNVFKGLLIWSILSFSAICYLSFTGSQLVWAQPFNPILIEFILGILLAFIISRGITAYPIACIATGVILFLIGAEVNYNVGNWEPWYRTICFGPASALIIYGVLAAEVRTGWIFSQKWRTVGDASYSIYIWHQLLFYSLFAVSKHFGIIGNVSPVLMVLVWMVLVLGWSIPFYFFVEKRVLSFLERTLVKGVNARAIKSNNWATSYNVAFFATVAMLPLFALIYTNYPARSETDNKVIASWPSSAGVDNNNFVGTPDVSSPAGIKLGSFSGYRTVRISITNNQASALYVGYKKNGEQKEGWHNFGPNGILSLDIEGPVDENIIWLNRDANLPSFSLRMVEVVGG